MLVSYCHLPNGTETPGVQCHYPRDKDKHWKGGHGEQNSVANICKEKGLPQCCMELVSFTFSCTSQQAAEKQGRLDYATGYLLNFTEERFSANV